MECFTGLPCLVHKVMSAWKRGKLNHSFSELSISDMYPTLLQSSFSSRRGVKQSEQESHVTEHLLQLEQSNKTLRCQLQMNQCLLHQMLPAKVASDLAAGRKVPPEAYDSVTIFFSDIQGFTEMSAKAEPIEVMRMLDRLYVVMDLCASLLPVYKVETIGDAYMVVGGLHHPMEGHEHASAVADFALLVRRAMQMVRNPLSADGVTRLRMGIHSGPVVAGVVGSLMPRYCLFGDSVNTASRMESTGEAGLIHCSEQTAALLGERGSYDLELRGSTPIKGKGVADTFWLNAGPDGPYSDTSLVEKVCKLIHEVPNAIAPGS